MHTFNTRGTCSRQINFDIVDGNVHNVSFVGGCDGNLKAISKLIEDKPVDWVVSLRAFNRLRDATRATSAIRALRRL